MIGKLSGPLSVNHVLFRRLRKLTNSTYNPLIKYDWSTLPVSSDYVTDGVEMMDNFNTHTDTSAWYNGIKTNEEDGFTKITYGNHTNIPFYFRASNSEFKEDLVIGTIYSVDVEVKTDAPLAYPSVGGYSWPMSSTDGIVKKTIVFEATSTQNMYARAYCDTALTRTMYWKLSNFQKVIQEPNKVYGKNIGTSKIPSKYFSGNPLDLQGSQQINVKFKKVFNPNNDFTLFFDCKSNSSNKTLFDAITNTQYQFSLYIYYSDDYPFRFSFGGAGYKLLFNDSSNHINNHIKYAIKRKGNQLFGYVNGLVNCSLDITNVTVETFENIFLFSSQGSSSFADCLSDNFILVEDGLDDSEIQRQFQYPTEFFQDIKNDDRTLFCTDFRGNKNIPYIADSKNLNNVGLVSDGTGRLIGDYFTFEDGIMSRIESSGDWTNAYITANLVKGKTYIFKHKFLNYVSGTYNLQDFVGNYYAYGISPSRIDSDGYYRKIFVAKSNTDGIGFRTGSLISSITDIEVEEYEGLHEILGYSETQRAFKTEETGIQDLGRKYDDLGFFLENTNYLSGSSSPKGKLVVPYKLNTANGSFTIEILVKSRSSYSSNTNIFAGGNSYLRFGGNSFIYCSLVGGSVSPISPVQYEILDKWLYMLVEVDTETNSLTLLLENEVERKSTDVSFVDNTSELNITNHDVKIFNLHPKIFTRAEKTTMFNDSKGLL